MRVTRAMIEAAQRGEFDYYQRGRKLGRDRFIPTPVAVVRAMLEAALANVALLDDPIKPASQAADPAKPRPKLTIVTARKPRSHR